ncbi:MAG TPA: DUF748 domain-containing protein, partial [Candidatus Binatia bacterium]|nr:DUF748 domain-containing protein [Candidatus Binatia bacterium]
GVIVFLGVAVVAAYRVGVRMLQDRVVAALGAGSRLSELKINWFSIELLGLSIDAPKGWPTARTLEAERVRVFPDLRSLLSDRLHVYSIVIENPYLSVLRNPGKLIIVPSLMERDGKDGAQSNQDQANGRAVTIAKIEIKNGSLDLYDATVSRPPLKVRMEEVEAVIRDVASPAAEKTEFDIECIVKGTKRDGRAKVSGWVGPGGRDSSSRVALETLDLVALQPYLVKKNEAQVARGTLDLKLDSEVRNNNLNGKGKIILHDLAFARSSSFYDTFMGLPRNAVINFLRDNNNAIDVDFTLSGNTKNPNFSLNENLSTRIATAMAGQLGVSIVGLAEGLGTLGRKGVEGAGAVVDGVGSAVKRIFGN